MTPLEYCQKALRTWEIREKEIREHITVDTESGHCVMVGLCKEENVAIARAHCVAGTVLKPHVHENEKEFVGVITGLCVIQFANGSTREVGPGGIVVFKPGEIHSATYPVDTDMWAVTVPAEPLYPSSKG